MRSVHTTNLTQIRDAQLQADGATLSVALAAMRLTDVETYDRDEILRERTAGQQSHSAELAWGNPRAWDLLCQRYGGERNLLLKEFELVFSAVPEDGAGQRSEYTFRRFRFRGRGAGTYFGVDVAEEAAA